MVVLGDFLECVVGNGVIGVVVCWCGGMYWSWSLWGLWGVGCVWCVDWCLWSVCCGLWGVQWWIQQDGVFVQQVVVWLEYLDQEVQVGFLYWF